MIDRAVMAYKGTETDVLYGVAIRPRGDGVIKGLKLGVAIRPRGDGVIKGLKLTYYMAWKWRGGLTPLLTRCSREASFLTAK